MENKYNLFFCLDNNYIQALPYVFRSFIVNNDPKLYVMNFVSYNIKDTSLISKIILNISSDFNIVIKKFKPSKDFIKLLQRYHIFLSKHNHKAMLSLNTFTNLGNWSRFYIYELFPNVEYGLYLDLDILFNNSINDLIQDIPKDNIIGIVPYKNQKIIEREQIISHNLDKKFNKKFNINSKLLNNNSYNCGVVYYNFELWRKKNMTSQILSLLNYSIRKNKLICYSGTEVIQNLLIPEYKIYSKKFNRIYNKSNVKKYDFSIIHFKGVKQHWRDLVYLKTFSKIIKSK